MMKDEFCSAGFHNSFLSLCYIHPNLFQLSDDYELWLLLQFFVTWERSHISLPQRKYTPLIFSCLQKVSEMWWIVCGESPVWKSDWTDSKEQLTERIWNQNKPYSRKADEISPWIWRIELWSRYLSWRLYLGAKRLSKWSPLDLIQILYREHTQSFHCL